MWINFDQVWGFLDFSLLVSVPLILLILRKLQYWSKVQKQRNQHQNVAVVIIPTPEREVAGENRLSEESTVPWLGLIADRQETAELKLSENVVEDEIPHMNDEQRCL